MYSCHLFWISSASVRSIPFLSFFEPIFAWNVPLVPQIFLKRSLVFLILLFSSISLHWSLKKAFLSLCAILWNKFTPSFQMHCSACESHQGQHVRLSIRLGCNPCPQRSGLRISSNTSMVLQQWIINKIPKVCVTENRRLTLPFPWCFYIGRCFLIVLKSHASSKVTDLIN